MCDVLIQMINRAVPVPAPSTRRRLWVRCGEQLRFASGLRMRVELHQADDKTDLRMHWHSAWAVAGEFTCYQPVSLVSDCGQRVVIRAVAMRAEMPIAVLVELEGVACEPSAHIERAA